MKALVVYHTKTGHTADAAAYVGEGLETHVQSVEISPVARAGHGSVEGSDIVVVGSPCRAGSVPLAGGVCSAVKAWLDGLGPGALKGQDAGAFSVHSHFGGLRTVRSMERRLEELGADIAAQGVAVKAGVAFSLWRGPQIGPADAERLRRFGAAVAHHAHEGTRPYS